MFPVVPDAGLSTPLPHAAGCYVRTSDSGRSLPIWAFETRPGKWSSLASATETTCETTPPNLPCTSHRELTSVCLHVVDKQTVLISEKEFSVGDDRVGPRLAVASLWLIEAALFHVTSRIGFDESDRSLLTSHVEMAVRKRDRSFANRS